MVRPDRIGDFVLTLPLIESLAKAWPQAEIEALLSPGVLPLAAAVPQLKTVLEDPGELFSLAGSLRARAYDLAIFPYASPRHALAVWLAGIPIRVGNGLRLYSPLFNRRVKVHRSRPPLHEADFCLSLLAPLKVPATSRQTLKPRLISPPEAQERAHELLAEAGLTPGEFLVVHPGGGGSAGRPGPEDFARFAQAAQQAACPNATLTVSAGPGEEALAQEVAKACGGRLLPLAPEVLTFQALLSQSCFFLAGSTGPLHVAASSGVPTLGFYPWKSSQTAARWAPLGPRARTLSPDPAPCKDCVDGRCTAPSCFARISLDEVAQLARELTQEET